MPGQFPQVPDTHDAPNERELKQGVVLQEIPSWLIRPWQLNSLLRSKYPAGGYRVEV
jgi:hypothetical protein